MLAGLAPAQVKCNYLTLAFRNVASLESENIGIGTLARAGFVWPRQDPTTRASPSSAPANGPSDRTQKQHGESSTTTTCTTTPTRTSPRPGQPAGCEAGNEIYTVGKHEIEQPAASKVDNQREFTSREEDLYGEPSIPLPAQASASGGQDNAPQTPCAGDEMPVLESEVEACPQWLRRDRASCMVVGYFGFTKQIPFKQGYQLKARSSIGAEHPPQVAGADRGSRRREVTGLHREGSTARHDGNQSAAYRSTKTQP